MSNLAALLAIGGGILLILVGISGNIAGLGDLFSLQLPGFETGGQQFQGVGMNP